MMWRENSLVDPLEWLLPGMLHRHEEILARVSLSLDPFSDLTLQLDESSGGRSMLEGHVDQCYALSQAGFAIQSS